MSENGRAPVLEFRGINTHYGAAHILKDVDIEIFEGEMVCLLGGNASGKTTTLKTILGIVPPTSGAVYLGGENVNGWTTADRVKAGVIDGPREPASLQADDGQENLEIGAYLREHKENLDDDLERIYHMFPRIKERLNQKAGTLSGASSRWWRWAGHSWPNPRSC
jgi:branched-chain amino acid transport system ATP-binding protein